MAFIYTNNEQHKKEVKKAFSFTIDFEKKIIKLGNSIFLNFKAIKPEGTSSKTDILTKVIEYSAQK